MYLNTQIMENKATGYICLFRSLRRHWIWKNEQKLKWWLDILLSANYKDNKVLIKGTLYDCKRGQCVKSTHTWAKEWRTTRNTVAAFLKLLKNDAMIELETLQNTTRITVCNYDSYNTMLTTSSPQPEPQPKPHPHHNLSTNNKDNKDNKGKQEKKIFIPPTLFEVENFFFENGYSKHSAKIAFDYYDVSNWQDSKGNKVRNWKQKMIAVWFKPENKIQPQFKLTPPDLS
jgi:hypothetical protein